MRIEYIANDGTRFNTEKECLDYEALIANTKQFNDVLKKIKAHCERIPDDMCDVNCPFMNICHTSVCNWELD